VTPFAKHHTSGLNQYKYLPRSMKTRKLKLKLEKQLGGTQLNNKPNSIVFTNGSALHGLWKIMHKKCNLLKMCSGTSYNDFYKNYYNS
jgi:hypothetical protein